MRLNPWGGAPRFCMIRSSLFNDPKCFQDTLNMIAVNLFRALPDITTVQTVLRDDV